MIKSKQTLITVLFICLFGAMIVFGVFANEARKEVYFLCQNFTPNTPEESVLRQLDTISLSRYHVSTTPKGKRIIHSSRLNFDLLSCTIDIDIGTDGQGSVTAAVYQ